MALDKSLLAKARKRMEEAERILVTSHVGPDGDAVCSTLALGLALQERGKAVQMVLSDGPSSGFDHLGGVEQIATKAAGPVDLVIAVDCGDQERLGDAIKGLPGVDINIDHHITNTLYAEINLVDVDSVAASALLAEQFETLGLSFSPPIVDALLTGMLTDTLGFRTSNMTPLALRLAADLLARGANIQKLYERALLRRSFEAMRYWGAGLSRLQREGALVWTSLTLADRKAANYPDNGDAELINALAATEGADITLLFIEQQGKQVKVSWRSRGEYDVAAIAASFGGGGHVAASGATVAGSMEEAQERVLAATRAALSVPA